MGRGSGFGNVTRRSKNWQARYTYRGVKYSKTFPVKSYATTWLEKERMLIGFGTWTPPKEREPKAEKPNVHTLEETYARFLEWRANKLASSTATNYERQWRLRIEPYWGAGRDIATITNDEVWAWRKGPLSEGLRADNAALELLRSMLRRATQWGWISKNPVEGVTIPRKKKALTQRHAFTLEQTRRYLEAAAPEHVTVLATVALAGLRSGEVRALRRGDIDLENQRLHVRQAIDHGRDVDGDWVMGLKDPKTAAGSRTVPFGGELAAVLREYFRAHPAVPGALAFRSATGGPLGPATIGHWHKKALANLGLCLSETEKRRLRRQGKTPPKEDVIRLHDLRASYATWLFTQGYTLPDVMQLLGWSDSRMALEVYSRVFPDDLKNVGQRQDDALGTLNVTPA